jgi:hypothetical protein
MRSNYADIVAMVSTEFHRYVMEHEDVADHIPVNALIIFQVEGEEDLSHWHKEISLRGREENQPVVYVHVKKWRTHSSIEELDLAEVMA